MEPRRQGHTRRMIGALLNPLPSVRSLTARVRPGPDRIAGRTILVTGVNSGLGLETARVLASRGARIFGAARTVEKAREKYCELMRGLDRIVESE